MFIECTACHARAQIPASKEGAKVRCPECGHVYVARAPGARARSQTDPTRYVLVGGGVLLLLVVGFLATRGGSEDKPVAAGEREEEAPEAVVSVTGWDAPVVQRAVQLHGQVLGLRSAALLTALDFERAFAWRAGGSAETTGWDALGPEDRSAFRDELVEALVNGEYTELIADWSPYDGEVVSEDDEQAVVRLKVHHREDLETQDRWIEWRFSRSGEAWLAWAWERWISPEEEERAARPKKLERRTLSDGSEVIEGKVRTEIEYHEETPEELRTEVEGLIDTLVDPASGPRQLTPARERLREIGKHAVPGLIRRLGAIPLDSEESAIQLNQIHLLLQDITGYLTTFDVHATMGTTEERQQSGIKQWFGWYDRRWRLYWRKADEVAEPEDPLWDNPAFQPRDERERKEFEKLRAEREARERDG